MIDNKSALVGVMFGVQPMMTQIYWPIYASMSINALRPLSLPDARASAGLWAWVRTNPNDNSCDLRTFVAGGANDWINPFNPKFKQHVQTCLIEISVFRWASCYTDKPFFLTIPSFPWRNWLWLNFAHGLEFVVLSVIWSRSIYPYLSRLMDLFLDNHYWGNQGSTLIIMDNGSPESRNELEIQAEQTKPST